MGSDVFNSSVNDPENLTPEWIEKMYDGGGFILQNCRTPEERKRLLDTLGLQVKLNTTSRTLGALEFSFQRSRNLPSHCAKLMTFTGSLLRITQPGCDGRSVI